MEINTNIPFEATHPGILIRDELECRDDISQKELASLLGVKASFLNEIISGKRPITADMAILLEKTLGISAEYWMRFQSQYEIDLARVKQKNIIKINLIDFWSHISQDIPVKYLKKQGYLTDDISENITKIKSIYSIENEKDLKEKFKEQKLAFFKKSRKLNFEENNVLAWTLLAEYHAKNKQVNEFCFEKVSLLIQELQVIFFNNKNVLESVNEKLGEYGIKFLLIDKIEKAPIDGYSFWSIDNPAIALSLRHKRIDNFAFTIMHEFGHISLHLRKDREVKFLDLTEFEENNFENEANEFAQDSLIPLVIWNNLNENYLPLNDENIIKFSNKYKINPAIVLGRICYEKNNYRIKSNIDKNMY